MVAARHSMRHRAVADPVCEALGIEYRTQYEGMKECERPENANRPSIPAKI